MLIDHFNEALALVEAGTSGKASKVKVNGVRKMQ